jgi:teichuronic acid biosynthesis glycosyltransferase TuaC
MRVLAITSRQPAPCDRQQLEELGRLCDLEVLASRTWFPGARLLARFTARHLPRIGGSLSAGLYAASLAREVIARRGRVDVVLGAGPLPDGCAAVRIGQLLGVPAVVKLRDRDLEIIRRMRGGRAQKRSVLPQAERVVVVSEALAIEAEVLGVPRDRIDVVEDGVDTDIFHPRDRAGARDALGLPQDRRLLLYAGNLALEKGVLDLARAFTTLCAQEEDVDLVIVGAGEARAALEAAVAPLGDRVWLAGARPHGEVAHWMAAADLVVLPSWSEGTPNVVLEALASGRRVVATSVGGVPDLLTSRVLGELVPARQPAELARALERALDARFPAEEVVRAGSRGSWSDSAAALAMVLEDARHSWERALRSGRRPEVLTGGTQRRLAVIS